MRGRSNREATTGRNTLAGAPPATAIPPPAQPLNRYELFFLEHHRFLLPKTALIT
ncbi:hypothetical protein LXL04_020568 [Taraxacum kok-saghyz]